MNTRLESADDPIGLKVRKAVFPVAGLGVRFLPATKAVAKEMLPLVDKPIIQYAVEEAIAAGIEEMIFITGRSKRALEDHFDAHPELEATLARQGKHQQLAELQALVPPGIRFSWVRQDVPRGLGHALSCARHLVGDDPFAVILPDDVMEGTPPPLVQLVAAFERLGSSVLAVERVERSETGKYGIVDTRFLRGGREKIVNIVEKPEPALAPSTLAVVGRYVLMPTIFDCLEDLPPGVNGEIQLSDAILRLLERETVFVHRYAGQRFDCGSKLGYLRATLHFGLQHPEVGPAFRQALAALEPAEPAAVVTEARPVRKSNGWRPHLVASCGAATNGATALHMPAGAARVQLKAVGPNGGGHGLGPIGPRSVTDRQGLYGE